MPLSNRTCFLVNLRDGLTCQRCGKQPIQAENYHQGFEYHHWQPRSQGGPNEPENIILLCRECHQASHRHVVTPEPVDLTPPDRLVCLLCGALINAHTVPMNCGWYHCPSCDRQIHLFQHFFAGKAP